MASFRQLQGMQTRRAASGLVDVLTQRFIGLSLIPHGTLQVRRGYARLIRARPRTPRATSTANTSLSSQVKSTAEVLPKGMDSAASNVKPPRNFKLIKLQAIETYDPNMVIFLDKSGNVSMIPHDDRVTGQTKEEYEGELDPNENGFPYQRGSKEMEYGRKRIGQIEIPIPIQDAVRTVLEEHDKSLIRMDALRLYGSLRSTGALDDGDHMELPTKSAFQEDMKSGSGGINKGDKSTPAHILEYGHRESKAYIAAMAPTTYCAIKNVLEEVNQRVPDLQPKTFLDFGTGPGTAIWAANEVWDTPLQYTGIDASTAMLETAEQIMDIMSSNGAHIPSVTFKPFASYGTHAMKHDIVMSAFTLSELTTPALRKATLEHLWESTNDMLILIDRGTPNGFRVLAEAREQILGLDADQGMTKTKYDAYGNRLPEEEPPKREPAHVLAPCPHDKVCPVFASLSQDSQWCHFSQKVQRPDFLRKTKHSKGNYEDSKYTYVILRKGSRPLFNPPLSVSASPLSTSTSTSTPTPISVNPSSVIQPQLSDDTQESTESSSPKRKKYKKPPPPPPVSYDNPEDMFAASYSWSRIVVPPLKKDGHVVIDTCAAYGYLERIIIPKSQGKIPYRDARKAMWGDLFPHEPKNRPVRREMMIGGGSEGEFGEEEQGSEKSARKRSSINPERLLDRVKQKEKKQSRQKVSLEDLEVDTIKTSRGEDS
ncbi:37S ribosomal protein S22 [Modicella reniformis]|uniref:37S ribosomal protein S22 n=1 Tax=Modicella reniformis TaxID=1440133 RepID=A0A9P6MBI9_9FUNG|nr:37S ribosomal protein S22 [Modicella reniformis]